jgi:pyruvate dehydrogenase (quinone)
VMGPTHVENVVDLACRTALGYRGVAHINFPVDLQDQEVSERSKRNIANHTSDVLSRRARLPAEDDIVKAAAVLNAGKKIAILCGRGALDATDELEAVAERLGAPIVKALLGKAAVPDMSPYTTGGIGLLGTKPSQEALENCDTLLMVGTSFPYIEFLPKPGQRAAFRSTWILLVSACATRLKSVSSATAAAHCARFCLICREMKIEASSSTPKPELRNGGN